MISSSDRKLGSIRCSIDLSGDYLSEYNVPLRIIQTNCGLFVAPPGREVGLVLGDHITIENVKGELVGDSIRFDNKAVWTKDTSKEQSHDAGKVIAGLSDQVVKAASAPKHPTLAPLGSKPFWESLGLGLVMTTSATAIGGLAAELAAREDPEDYQKASAAKYQNASAATKAREASRSAYHKLVQREAATTPSPWHGMSFHVLVLVSLSLSILAVLGCATACCRKRSKMSTRSVSLVESQEYSGCIEEGEQGEHLFPPLEGENVFNKFVIWSKLHNADTHLEHTPVASGEDLEQ